MKRQILISISLLLVISAFFPDAALAAPAARNGILADAQVPNNEITQLLSNMRGPNDVAAKSANGKSARVTFKNGYLRSLGAPAGHYFPVIHTVAGDSTATAKNFIAEHSAAYGVISAAVDFSLKKSRKRNGLNFERFQQTYSKIPVFGAEMLIQLNDAGGVEFAVSDIMRDTSLLDSRKVSTIPAISANDAKLSAIALMAEEHPGLQLENTEPQLMIYQPEVVGNFGQTRLVWQTEVISVSTHLVDEFILVDAHTGDIALHFTLIKHARNREVYDSDSTEADPGTLVRSEGDPPSGIVDADNCYDFLGDTYDFYFNEHGRDSINNAGMTLSATVRYCPTPDDCPYQNAFWDGSRMYFGEGFTADDVTAHELTHGVTQYESNLIYMNESGAINESFSDMWGEWVDLTNGAGNDTPSVRWLMGEDIPGGAIRNMANPPTFGDPDSKCSPLWYDNGGVHTNSGVGNKLCYLLTDGGTFRDVEIMGMGISAAADLFYEAQTSLLTAASDYADLHTALTQAAINLGWNDVDKYNLENACLLTELTKCFDPCDIIDLTPPSPNPAEWGTGLEPNATGLHTIAMEARKATDRSDVEYFFECVTDANKNSDWQDSTLYERGDFDANTTYTFKVKCRDKSDFQNETGWSTEKSTTTCGPTDTLPPFPSKSLWKIKPMVLRLQPTPQIRMSAVTSTDENSPVAYYFKCTHVEPVVPDPNVFNRGWITSSYITISSGLDVNSTYTFTVKARDGLLNETAESIQASVTVGGQSGTNVLTVPVPYATIQDAINAASDGDIVEVRPGTYRGLGNRDLDFLGKAITVKNVAPNNPSVVAATIIDCQGVWDAPHRAFYFHSGEGSNSILAGFTITNGWMQGADGLSASTPGGSGTAGYPAYGGAIFCGGSSPTIRNCVIADCAAAGGYGGFGQNGDQGVPTAIPPIGPRNGGSGGMGGSAYGGGIYCDTSNAIISGCEIRGCAAIGGIPGLPGDGADGTTLLRPTNGGGGGWGGSGYGGGIYCASSSNAIITNSRIISYNSAVGWAGALGGLAGAMGGVGPPANNGATGGNGNARGGGACYGSSSIGNMSDTTVSDSEAVVVDWYSVPQFQIVPGSQGGGIFCNTNSTVTLTGCDISNNEAIEGDGGGIWYEYGGTLTLNNCTVQGNIVPENGFGGGIYAGNTASTAGTTVIIDNNSTITGNTGGYGGGGLLLVETNLTLNDSTISNNNASEGAGVLDYNCVADVNDCTIRDNSATDLGGGFSFISGLATIENCVMTGNSASGVGGAGGALYFLGWSDYPHKVTNCLITDNTAYSDGGGLSNNLGSWVQVTNCTFVGNGVIDSDGVGGGVSCAEYLAWVELINSILWDNFAARGPQIGVGTPSGSDPYGPDAWVDVDHSDVEGGEDDVFLENPGHTEVWWMYGSFDEDPLFATTKAAEQTYFLSQVAAGQLKDSNCVDAGDSDASVLESIIGMPLTTRTDLVADSCTVDMGYHYQAGAAVGQYRLTIEVVDQGYGTFGTVLPPWEPGTYDVNQGRVIELHAEPNDGWEVYQWTGTDYVPVYPAEPNYNTVTMDSDKTVTVEFGPRNAYKLVTHVIGNGTIEPPVPPSLTGGLTIWPPGTVVALTATPANPSQVVIWTGTDDDFSDSHHNTVTMNTHKEVTAEFYAPRTLYVPGKYPTIQAAIDDADDGDIIEISSAPEEPYYTSAGFYIDGKAITITSTNPDDPCCVANTIIQMDVGPGDHVGPLFFFNNVGRNTVLNGLTINGARIDVYGGYGGDGILCGDPGGNGGWVSGIGISCGFMYDRYGIYGGNASPTIKNCIITDCTIRGGDGGNGFAGCPGYPPGAEGGWPGGAYGAAMACFNGSSPVIINCTFRNNVATGGIGGDGGNGNNTPPGPWGPGGPGGGWYYGEGSRWHDWDWFYGPYGLYTEYTGRGGAVYVDQGCSPVFVDCTFTNNRSFGGANGICGIDGAPVLGREEPSIRWKIDNFGGAVYVAGTSTSQFVGCVFNDNLADTNPLPESSDLFVSYGGAIAFEDGADLTIEDCTFNDNVAAIGGGLYWSWSDPRIEDSNFVGNSALHGGGVLFVGGTVNITGSNFGVNEATATAGQGGGICCLGANAGIVDCNIVNNNTNGSGGGIYISNKDVYGEDVSALIKNCLITGNFASRDGGGISANWYSEPNIINCTIADNRVTGTGFETGYGGGVYCSYNSYVNIINSIIWGNSGTEGAQLAIATGFVYDPRPSTVDVSYSVIGPPRTVSVVTEPAEALTITVTNDATVLADTILGPGIDVVGQPQYTGAGRAAGTFVGGLAAGIGIESGIILTSGDANLAMPPNKSDGITGDNNLPGDTDLDALLQARGGAADINTFDATIFEFTFRTKGGNLFFNFVFASDEYNEFTNSQFNDVFGFFLDGTNIALIPGTTTPVAINNVNGGNPLGTDASNPQLFHNNDLSDGGPFFSIEYDGFTNVFTARSLNVGSGIHTIKLAIADTSDRVLDSAVFIQAGSFSDKPSYSDPIYVDANCALIGWDPNASDPNNPWDPNFVDYNNINADPCFVAGYYLSQVLAGQNVDSPCVDKGSTDANDPNIGLGIYRTTRTDSANDVNIIDMGYHYMLFIAPQYQLTTTAIEVNGLAPADQPVIDPNDGLYYQHTVVHLTVSPSPPPSGYQVLWTGTDDDTLTSTENTVLMVRNKTVTVTFVRNVCDLTTGVIGLGGTVTAGGTFPRGAVVPLIASPGEGYRIKRWIGTDNDASVATTNTVTMNGDMAVYVEFELPVTINVPSSDYSSIQQALDAAEEGDTVLIAKGTYATSAGYYIHDANITISGTVPEDPCVVADTVIEMELGEEGYVNTSGLIFYNVGPETILNGITIRRFVHQAYSGLPGDELGEEGYNGDHAFGGGIICYMASPTIKNCIITDCSVIGGNGGDGFNGGGSNPADPNINGTDGGWPGRAYGGGLACLVNSNPAVINCSFENCRAAGGNGGNGGNGNTTEGSYGQGGRGGGWYYGEYSRWYNVPWDGSSQGYSRYGPVQNSYYDFYTKYTGRGGAAFVGEQCSPTFTHCTFTNNRTEGGTCGITGLDGWPPVNRVEPSIPWKIDNFGGAVFCEANSSPVFTDCNFAGNTADTNYPANNDNPYVSYGGAVAWETGADIILENCIFSENLAAIGGAMYGSDASVEIVNCNISGNLAYQGGGVFGTSGSAIIENCIIQNNFAGVAPEDINDIGGQGGGIYSASVAVDIFDCNISDNEADTSGGGIFFTGVAGSPLVTNCLITSNLAGRDGGGISANWHSEPNIVNCTIAGNVVTGIDFAAGYGGGLCCSYGNYTNIINSIIWGNSGQRGPQLAIGTGFEYDPRPSTVNVSYSDVEGGKPYVFKDLGCTFSWDDANNNNIQVDPCFVTGPLGSYYLSQIDTNDPSQTTDSPCVDTGNDQASNVGLSYPYTTRTDEVFDTNVVDMGYHYLLAHPIELCSFCDLSRDGIVNFSDLEIFILHWLDDDCSADNDWCGRADLTFDTYVNFNDFAALSKCWYAEDTDAPLPNPSKWKIAPYSTTPPPPYIISMTAEAAFDSWGGVVEYYFECVTGNDSNRPWDPNATYVTIGHPDSNTAYGYRVKARDERGHETLWSEIGYAVTGQSSSQEDDDPPTPVTWASVPAAVVGSSTSITMTSTHAQDIIVPPDTNSPPVQYYFQCTTDGDANSNWQASETYVATGLTPSTLYTFTVRARDSAIPPNETGLSDPASATTNAQAQQNLRPYDDSILWATTSPTPPYETVVGSNAYANMSAQVAIDPEGLAVQYWFECVGHETEFNSGWINDPQWQVYIGPPGQGLSFHFKARDTSPDLLESVWSTTRDCYVP